MQKKKWLKLIEKKLKRFEKKVCWILHLGINSNKKKFASKYEKMKAKAKKRAQYEVQQKKT